MKTALVVGTSNTWFGSKIHPNGFSGKCFFFFTSFLILIIGHHYFSAIGYYNKRRYWPISLSTPYRFYGVSINNQWRSLANQNPSSRQIAYKGIALVLFATNILQKGRPCNCWMTKTKNDRNHRLNNLKVILM